MRSLLTLATCVVLLGPAFAQDAKQPALNLTLRRQQRVPTNLKDRDVEITTKGVWPTKETAIIVCDMWDAHHCLNAVRRLEEMVPTMNRVLEKARDQGVLIIHAPSSCMDAYKDHPARKRAEDAPTAKTLPKDIGQWCYKIPAEEKGKYPIDQSNGGEDDDPAEHAEWHAKLKAMGRNPKAPWKSQHAGIKIHDQRRHQRLGRRDLERPRQRAASTTSSSSACTPTCACSAGRLASGRWRRTARTWC